MVLHYFLFVYKGDGFVHYWGLHFQSAKKQFFGLRRQGDSQVVMNRSLLMWLGASTQVVRSLLPQVVRSLVK